MKKDKTLVKVERIMGKAESGYGKLSKSGKETREH